MKKAVVLLSGGLDSAVTAFLARKDIGKRGGLYALTLDYGQVHSRELSSAERIAKVLEVEEFREEYLTIPCESALTSGVQGAIRVSGVELGIPETWVPQRNSVFLALAFAYAEGVGADWVYIGVNSIDYSGYPDCRSEFVAAMNKALNLASKRYVETGRGIGIVTPLMHKRKSEIVQLGVKLGVPFGLTTSCYFGGERACGVCDACRIRLEAFRKVGIGDPIPYKE